MSDDYLFNGTGKPDPELEDFELLLSRFGHSGGGREEGERLARAAARRRGYRVLLAVAAASLLVLFLPTLRDLALERWGESWQVVVLDGTPLVDARESDAATRLAHGQWLETGHGDRAKLVVADIGELVVQPDTRLRLLRTREGEHRVALEVGEVHATTVAPPREFFIETGAGIAADLGCEFTLAMNEEGSGRLVVQSGEVGFSLGGRESLVPQGGACNIREGFGAGTPYRVNAGGAFVRALEAWDFADGSFADVLAEATPSDGLSLLEAFPKLDEETRLIAHERLVSFAAPPSGVSGAQVLSLEESATRRWRVALRRAWKSGH